MPSQRVFIIVIAKPYYLDEWLWINLNINYVSPTLTTSKCVALFIFMKKKKIAFSLVFIFLRKKHNPLLPNSPPNT